MPGEREEIAGAIRAQIIKVGRLEAASVTDQAELVHDLGMSSLELLAVLAFVEKTYGVSIRDEELVSLTTLARIVDKVESLLGS